MIEQGEHVPFPMFELVGPPCETPGCSETDRPEFTTRGSQSRDASIASNAQYLTKVNCDRLDVILVTNEALKPLWIEYRQFVSSRH